MEWMGNGRPVCSGEESSAPTRGFNHVQPHEQQSPSSQLCDSAMASLCQSQQRCVKASVMFGWRLAEAQDQLCSLEVHSSESVQQERARTRACPTELSHTEQEWQRKESMLAGSEPSCSPVLRVSASWDVFNKSIINVQYPSRPVDQGQETCKTFIQQYEEELKHFGMLHRWDDSQRFLSDMPHLICEETANFLILWCITLQKEGKEALMAQVAHQAVVMQFILEMASNSNQDPRGCFRPFFHKAKEGSNVYQEVFHSELEAFKLRIKDYAFKCKENSINSAGQQRSDPKDSLLSVAECSMKHGLWTNTVRLTKEDDVESEDILMMETS
ncbi:hsp90 co-chaperone Cdc37-like 1 [Periophthalmus magnuspinnatus]|uniref:hsp90 co-chaperone Cdc37-like 1 n=1 Tax=Periophthalmus magnuspinnatus TaxID=409849 RepID=UPI00145BED8B|nr:hsp90 co-chaperone Cdc37-like 1 [Periophthalmus magnuspinnatus]